MFNLKNIVSDLHKNLRETESELEKTDVVGESGGGLVKVEMNGNKVLTQIIIDPSIEDDLDTIKDLIVAAVNAGNDKADELKKSLVEKSTGNLPNIPGVDMSKFFNG